MIILVLLVEVQDNANTATEQALTNTVEMAVAVYAVEQEDVKHAIDKQILW